jgi:hypothetical protein
MEVSGKLHALAALHPEKEPGYPLDRRLVNPIADLDAAVSRNSTICKYM